VEDQTNKLLAENHHNDTALDSRAADCAPDFTSKCFLGEKVETRFTDAKNSEVDSRCMYLERLSK
jgi:hypothetical protein